MVCDSPMLVRNKEGVNCDVPCGRCPPCKQRRVASWCFRLKQEEKQHLHAHFVTFTYDTATVPITENGFMSLRKKDMQDFMKRLRKLVGVGMKYYLVGEYGAKTNRPHYHAIIFGVADTQHYIDSWKDGTIFIGNVSGASVAYTLKYLDKPHWKKWHDRDDRAPQFSLMSKGLGANYLSDPVVKYHRQNIEKLYVTDLGGVKLAMPKYYRSKIWNDDERAEQVDIVQYELEKAERLKCRQYEIENNPISYDQHQSMCRLERFRRFYRSQSNNRNTV